MGESTGSLARGSIPMAILVHVDDRCLILRDLRDPLPPMDEM